jgi:hypothetical protein
MAVKWTYAQWLAKYGDVPHTNRPLNGIYAGTEWFEQAQQLADTKWSLDELQQAITYWRGVTANAITRANPGGGSIIDPYYDNNPPPVFQDDIVTPPGDEQLVEEHELMKTMNHCFGLLKPHYPKMQITFAGINFGARLN